MEFLAAYEQMEGLWAPLRWVARVTDKSPASPGDTPNAAADGTAAGTEPVLPQGRTVGGYELLARIGRGRMGVVYKARQAAANRLVALKMVRASRLGDARPGDGSATRRRRSPPWTTPISCRSSRSARKRVSFSSA